MKTLQESIIGRKGVSYSFNSRNDFLQGDIVYFDSDDMPYMYVTDKGIINTLFLGNPRDHESRDGIFVYAYNRDWGIKVRFLTDYDNELIDTNGKYDIDSVYRGDITIPKSGLLGFFDKSNLKNLTRRCVKIWGRK